MADPWYHLHYATDKVPPGIKDAADYVDTRDRLKAAFKIHPWLLGFALRFINDVEKMYATAVKDKTIAEDVPASLAMFPVTAHMFPNASNADIWFSALVRDYIKRQEIVALATATIMNTWHDVVKSMEVAKGAELSAYLYDFPMWRECTLYDLLEMVADDERINSRTRKLARLMLDPVHSALALIKLQTGEKEEEEEEEEAPAPAKEEPRNISRAKASVQYAFETREAAFPRHKGQTVGGKSPRYAELHTAMTRPAIKTEEGGQLLPPTRGKHPPIGVKRPPTGGKSIKMLVETGKLALMAPKRKRRRVVEPSSTPVDSAVPCAEFDGRELERVKAIVAREVPTDFVMCFRRLSDSLKEATKMNTPMCTVAKWLSVEGIDLLRRMFANSNVLFVLPDLNDLMMYTRKLAYELAQVVKECYKDVKTTEARKPQILARMIWGTKYEMPHKEVKALCYNVLQGYGAYGNVETTTPDDRYGVVQSEEKRNSEYDSMVFNIPYKSGKAREKTRSKGTETTPGAVVDSERKLLAEVVEILFGQKTGTKAQTFYPQNLKGARREFLGPNGIMSNDPVVGVRTFLATMEYVFNLDPALERDAEIKRKKFADQLCLTAAHVTCAWLSILAGKSIDAANISEEIRRDLGVSIRRALDWLRQGMLATDGPLCEQRNVSRFIHAAYYAIETSALPTAALPEETEKSRRKTDTSKIATAELDEKQRSYHPVSRVGETYAARSPWYPCPDLSRLTMFGHNILWEEGSRYLPNGRMQDAMPVMIDPTVNVRMPLMDAFVKFLCADPLYEEERLPLNAEQPKSRPLELGRRPTAAKQPAALVAVAQTPYEAYYTLDLKDAMLLVDHFFVRGPGGLLLARNEAVENSPYSAGDVSKLCTATEMYVRKTSKVIQNALRIGEEEEEGSAVPMPPIEIGEQTQVNPFEIKKPAPIIQGETRQGRRGITRTFVEFSTKLETIKETMSESRKKRKTKYNTDLQARIEASDRAVAKAMSSPDVKPSNLARWLFDNGCSYLWPVLAVQDQPTPESIMLIEYGDDLRQFLLETLTSGGRADVFFEGRLKIPTANMLRDACQHIHRVAMTVPPEQHLTRPWTQFVALACALIRTYEDVHRAYYYDPEGFFALAAANPRAPDGRFVMRVIKVPWHSMPEEEQKAGYLDDFDMILPDRASKYVNQQAMLRESAFDSEVTSVPKSRMLYAFVHNELQYVLEKFCEIADAIMPEMAKAIRLIAMGGADPAIRDPFKLPIPITVFFVEHATIVGVDDAEMVDVLSKEPGKTFAQLSKHRQDFILEDFAAYNAHLKNELLKNLEIFEMTHFRCKHFGITTYVQNSSGGSPAESLSLTCNTSLDIPESAPEEKTSDAEHFKARITANTL